MVKKICISAILLASMTLPAFAFSNGDFQIWNTESIDWKIDKKLSAKVEQELRFGDNVTELFYLHTDGGFNYKLMEHLYFGANYRHVIFKNKKKWVQEYRPHINLTLKGKWEGFKLSNRNRLEYRIFGFNKRDTIRYRNKTTVGYPFEWEGFKLEPYAADEIFVSFTYGEFTRNRLYAGLKFDIVKNLKGDIFYLWQISRKKEGKWPNTNVLGLKLKFVF